VERRTVAKQNKAKVRKPIRETALPLVRQNFVILGAGILVIAAGYVAMIEGSIEGFLPLVVSPILLVLGYCVIIPIGILYRKRSHPAEQKEAPAGPARA
jgi:hypothetical protein